MTEFSDEVLSAITWLNASIMQAEHELADLETPEMMRRLSRFNGRDPKTFAYWKAEYAFWQDRRKTAIMDDSTAALSRADEALLVCNNQILGMLHHGR